MVTTSDEDADRDVARRRAGPEVSDEEEDIAELKREAQRRLAKQMGDAEKAKFCDYVLKNGGSLAELEAQVDALWPVLVSEARTRPRS